MKIILLPSFYKKLKFNVFNKCRKAISISFYLNKLSTRFFAQNTKFIKYSCS